MKNGFLSILVFISTFFALSDTKGLANAKDSQPDLESKNFGTGFFITDSGMAVASYHAVADATDISAQVNGSSVSFEIMSKDTVNDIAILKSKSKIQSNPVTLLMGDIALASSITNISFPTNISIPSKISTDQKDPANSQSIQTQSFQGIVKFASGVAGDIRHIELEFSAEIAPKEGPVFNDKGLCIGWISNHATDIFSLLYEPKNSSAISLATKVDYLYPLIKNLPGVLWAKVDNAPSPSEEVLLQKDSIVRLEIKRNAANPDSSGDLLKEIRSQVPEGGLFISVSVASGISNIDFANKLLDQLTKHKIGKTISPAVKQKYYQAIYERFGSSLTADQLVKTASDLSNGYYLDAACNVVTEAVEDSVSLTLFQPRTGDVLAQVRSAKVIKSNPDEAIMQLTEMAVKELAKQLKNKKLLVFAD